MIEAVPDLVLPLSSLGTFVVAGWGIISLP
jgi:hypothetical protein